MKVIKKCGAWFLGEIKWAVDYQILHLRVFWKEVGEMFDNSAQGIAYRLVFLVGLVTIMFWFGLGVVEAYGVVKAELPFTREYVANKIHQPKRIIVVNPTVAKIAQVEVKEVAEIKEIPENTFIKDVVRKVYQLESSSGKNDFSKCVEAGKFNGYGFGIPSPYKWMCFDSHEEATEAVTKWFEKKLADNTLEESLCIYNTGIKTSSCGYVNKFNSLN